MMNDSLRDLTVLRHQLHRLAENSGGEEKTAGAVAGYLENSRPDKLIKGLGGHGVAAVYTGRVPGPRLLIRCELDAVCVSEIEGRPHGSEAQGVSHACGHDGHMAIVAGLAPRLRESPPERGEAVLLFQPAEETGQGAAAVLEDPRFSEIRPDRVFALHNLPGYGLGEVLLRDGTFAYAAAGLDLEWRGASSHASQPEAGTSPIPAVQSLLLDLRDPFAAGLAYPPGAYSTVTHLRIGDPTFGVSPGTARVMATLRAGTSSDLQDLIGAVRGRITHLADRAGLESDLSCEEVFPATVNDAESVRLVEEAAITAGLRIRRITDPFRWSEDFGHFTDRFPGALFGIGAGEDHAPLHSSRYDFPDDLLEPGIELFLNLLQRLLT